MKESWEKKALEEMAEELMFVAEIDQKAEALPLAKWLLQEDARFDREEERAKAEYLARKAAASKPWRLNEFVLLSRRTA